MSETLSMQQIAANQANALKSTGPKTPEGRAVSKMNALKMGIFSKEVLVRSWNFKESRAEFYALYERFWQEYSPAGPAEEMLLDQIVSTHWRLRRVLRAESGEIALSVDQGHWRRSQSHSDWKWLDWMILESDPAQEMRHSAEGNSMMVLWLEEVRTSVEQDGELTEEAVNIPFFGIPNGISRNLERLRLFFSQKPDGPDPTSQREENKQQALRAIDLELAALQRRKADCEEREAAQEKARQAAAVLPSPERLDKIMRYEAMLQRKLYRAMNQLERLQRMRQGEAVPPPLTMEVSERV